MLNEISIEIIRKCPNKCIHCSSMSSESCKEIIPYDKFCEVIDSAIGLGLKTVCFSGGEPFLHPDLAKMIRYVKSQGLQSYVYTSGICFSLIGEKTSLSLQMLSEISGDVTKLIFNVESAEESVYDTIMGTKNCFELMKKSIMLAVNLGITVEGHFVPMKLNLDQIEKTFDMCLNLGITKLSFLRLVLHGRAQINEDRLSLSEEELEYVRTILSSLYSENINSIRIGVPLLGETSDAHCEAAIGKINIRYDGNVYPCEVFKNNQQSFISGTKPDSIFDLSFRSIYNHSSYLAEVRKMVNEHGCSQCCDDCVGQYYLKDQRGHK